MPKQLSVYVFNAVQAQLLAKENPSSLFFYDGVLLEDAVINAIHVPINTFYDYFLKTLHPQISQINFDGMNFSDDIKTQITQSLTDSIVTIKNQKVEILNTLLQTEINIKNCDVMLYTFLKYLYEEQTTPQNISLEIVKKLLAVSVFTQNNTYIPSPINCDLISHVLSIFKENHTNNFMYYHLYFALQILENNHNPEKMREDYFSFLTSFKYISQMHSNFSLVKTLYPDTMFERYIELFSKHLFKHDFFDHTILEQKEIIYKFYFLSNSFYERSISYKKIYNILYPIFLEALRREVDELIFFLYTPLIMSYSGVVQTQDELKQFNTNVDKKLENYIQISMLSKYSITPNTKKFNANAKKIKIAFLQERIIPYSIHKVFLTLIKSLNEHPSTRFEFIIYDLNFMEFSGSNSETVSQLKAYGFTYIDLHKYCSNDTSVFYPIVEKSLEIRKKIIQDDIDILVGMHSRPEYNFLFTSRVAPMQVYWSHGNHEYDITAIDKRITHYQHVDCTHHFNFFKLPRDKESLNPFIEQSILTSIRDKYPKESIILASIGRLSKMENIEYLRCVNDLLIKYPNTLFLACGSGNTTKIKELLHELSTPMDRFIFTGFINAHEYGNIIDILLNTFPQEQGEAVAELAAKAKPIVSLKPSQEQISNESQEIYPNIESPFVLTTQEYMYIASRLIEDQQYRNDVGQCNLRYIEKMFFLQESTFLKSLGF